jgi:hypothetical protein
MDYNNHGLNPIPWSDTPLANALTRQKMKNMTHVVVSNDGDIAELSKLPEPRTLTPDHSLHHIGSSATRSRRRRRVVERLSLLLFFSVLGLICWLFVLLSLKTFG